MKKVLITGAGSYVGDSFAEYAASHYGEELHAESVDMLDGSWRDKDFATYDVVFHVAGIAHADVGKVSEETKARYYAVNTDLALEVARKAKESGVGQLVFMSSAIVYGDSAPYGLRKRITSDTEPEPSNFYGDSKWQADQGVRALADEGFVVTVLRPPMIYGRGSKGNYPVLASLAKRLPIFPDVDNERSMLYVESLCEFLCQVMVRGEGGVFWPQNPEHCRTSEVVRHVAEAAGHRIWVSKAWNWAAALASKLPGKPSALANKAFGSLSYDLSMSDCGFDYQVCGLEESIRRTESRKGGPTKRRALQLASVASMIDQFNMPNIELLLSLGYEVDVVADFADPGTITRERSAKLRAKLEGMGVTVRDVPIPRTLSPRRLVGAYRSVRRIIREGRYDLIHCHSPIGGAICRVAAREARRSGTRVIYTAHGFHFYDGAPLKNWLAYYPIEWFLSSWTDVLVTINREDYERACRSFHAGRVEYVPGVGVDAEKFGARHNGRERIRAELDLMEGETILLSVGELNENKNHSAVIRAVDGLGLTYVIVGKGDKADELARLAEERGVDLRLMGFREDVADFYDAADVYVLPSIREGLNVSIMEAMASGLPVACGRIRGNVDLIDRADRTLFNPMDERDVRRAIVNALDRAIELGKKNIEIIQRFDVTNVTDAIADIYEGSHL